MAKNKFFIGIDSGGSKTELAASESGERIIFKKKFDSVHYTSSGRDKTAVHLGKIISEFLRSSGLDLNNCGGICIGISGAREKSDKSGLRKRICDILGFRKIIIESDTVIAQYGAFKGNDGLILICGTGSILHGTINGKPVRIGGWGKIIGDYGSGFEIGKAALKHLASEYDRGKKISRLAGEIEKRFSFNRNNIIKKIYHGNFDLQKVAPLILELAGKKDRDAGAIIDESLNGLIKHIDILTARHRNSKTDIAFTGSIIENNNILSRKLTRKIRERFGNKINIVNKIHTPSEGAILLAKNKFKKN